MTARPEDPVDLAPGDERLIDRVPVSYAPSLTALRACLARDRREDRLC